MYLEASSPQQRIVKRSASMDDFYHRNDDDCLEVAANVVFERLRKDEDTSANNVQQNARDSSEKENYDHNNNRVRREVSTTEENPVEDLKYKQLVFEDDANDPEAKTIDFETLQRKNRPADVLEYKRFLNVSFVGLRSINKTRRGFLFQNQPLDDGKPPKKANTHSKTRVKPPPAKVMVKRDSQQRLLSIEMLLENDGKDEVNRGSDEDESLFSQQRWSSMQRLPQKGEEDELDEDDDIDDDDDDEDDEDNQEDVQVPLVRTRRYVWVPHGGQSPHTVAYAANYNDQENKGWVKPLFSSIVYRLPVRVVPPFPISHL